jgi:transposase
VEAAGHVPRLSNCYKVEHMRKARALPKTNKRDADLVSMLPQESKPWWVVWRAPPEVRDLREWMRHRVGLVGMQTEVKNRVHALFHRHGIFYEEATDLFGGEGRRFLFALGDTGRHENGTLPEGALEVLRSDLRILMMLRAELATITWRLHGRLKRDPLVRRLMTIPGIGLILAAVNVRFRDVSQAVPFLTQVWMFATPVAYPLSTIPTPGSSQRRVASA